MKLKTRRRDGKKMYNTPNHMRLAELLCEVSTALKPDKRVLLIEWKESMMLQIKVALVEFVETYEDGKVYIVSGDGSQGYGIGVVGLDAEYRPPIDTVRLLKDVTEYFRLMAIISKETSSQDDSPTIHAAKKY